MEVNNLLCVGRSRRSQFGKSHLPDSGFRTPEKTTFEEMSNEAGLTEKDLVARVSSKLSSGCLSPPTKSILRGRVPSPNQSSPSSNRSVRFSDKESDDEVMYAKIHINKNIQTEHIHTHKTVKETRGRDDDFKLDLAKDHSEFKQAEVHEIKTSTPRYSQFEETPSLDFHTPRGRQDDRKNLQLAPMVSQSELSQGSGHFKTTQIKKLLEHKHERIIIDIDIGRKRPTEENELKSEPELPRSNERKSRKNTPDATRDGSKIIQNMNLNPGARSNSAEGKQQEIPDGSKIIQNMELNSSETATTRFRSTASQTSCSDTSSPRSVSPESPYPNSNPNPDIPDGSRIIKNMELNSLDSSLTMKAKSVQTLEIPDGKKIIQNLELSSHDSSLTPRSQPIDTLDRQKITPNMDLTLAQKKCQTTSAEIQTLNPQDLKEKRFRSVPVQTVLDISEENSPNDSFNISKSRSIAVQTAKPNEPKIPDGSKIIRNMEIHKVENPKHFTDSSDDKKSLNDSNWNEFVRHLEMFNPSSSSSSSVSVSGDEPPPTPTTEPVLVYDRNAPSPETINSATAVKHNEETTKEQQLSNRNARAFLVSEAFNRHQIESVLREEGLLSKYETGLKTSPERAPSTKSSVSKAFTGSERTVNVPTVNAAKPSIASTTFTKQKLERSSVNRNGSGQKTVFSHPNESSVVDNSLKTSRDINIYQYKRQQKPDKENFGFTPIETYSFNPETLIKTAAKRACSATKSTAGPLKPHITSNTKMNMSSTFDSKESFTKNSFVQGLDLGPVPKPISPQRYSSLLSSTTESDKRYRTSSSRDNAYSCGFPEKMQKEVATSSLRSFQSSSIAGSSYRPMSLSGYKRSTYSHVTGHSSGQSSSEYLSSQSRYRPSSAPSSRGNVYPSTSTLSSSLKEMRSSAVRKSAMHQFADYKRHSPSIGQLLSDATPTTTYKSRFDHQKSVHHTSTKYLQSTSESQGIGAKSFSPRQISPDRSNYMYLDALNDQSNARPLSRDRSRSRSPHSTARNVYDDKSSVRRSPANTRLLSGSSANLDAEVREYVGTYKDYGNFDSVISRGHVKSNVTASMDAVSFTTSRESRAVTRKPPLPSSMKTPRSYSQGRSRSRSADRKVEESTKPANEVKRAFEYDDTENTSKPSHHLREKQQTPEQIATENEEKCTTHKKISAAKNISRGEDSIQHGLGTVTIGGVPTGLADPDCMYLGHDTIQKIINEAKL